MPAPGLQGFDGVLLGSESKPVSEGLEAELDESGVEKGDKQRAIPVRSIALALASSASTFAFSFCLSIVGGDQAAQVQRSDRFEIGKTGAS